MEKISAVYKIVNTVTGDSYVGSSKDVMRRWEAHKWPSLWKRYPNKPLYQDMQKYGVDKFMFQILAPVMPEYLTQVEQEFIEMLQPTYNRKNAKGMNVERRDEMQSKYQHSERYKEIHRKANRKYRQSNKGKEVQRNYNQIIKHKYDHLCLYNGETLTFRALYLRFYRAGVEHPRLEAKKYLIKN